VDLAECCNSSQRENTDKKIFASFVFWEKHAVMINMLASTIISRKYIAERPITVAVNGQTALCPGGATPLLT
jgi:hypothetical protein